MGRGGRFSSTGGEVRGEGCISLRPWRCQDLPSRSQLCHSNFRLPPLLVRFQPAFAFCNWVVIPPSNVSRLSPCLYQLEAK